MQILITNDDKKWVSIYSKELKKEPKPEEVEIIKKRECCDTIIIHNNILYAVNLCEEAKFADIK